MEGVLTKAIYQMRVYYVDGSELHFNILDKKGAAEFKKHVEADSSVKCVKKVMLNSYMNWQLAAKIALLS